MELDSGSDGAIVLNRAVAGLVLPGGSTEAAESVVLRLVGGVSVEGKARIDELSCDGNIGLPVLKGWIVTMDLVHERLWITPRPEAEARTSGRIVRSRTGSTRRNRTDYNRQVRGG